MFRGRRGAIRAIVILTLVAAAAALLDPPTPPIAGRARASDGDSFRIGDQRVRLLGVDAPELAQTCTDRRGAEWPCGQRARDRMAALLAGGAVDCRPEDTDRYGRILARCSVSGADLGAIMVEEGWAIASGDYWQQEAAAKKRSAGIWQGGFDLPRNWRDDHARPSGLGGWLGLLGF